MTTPAPLVVIKHCPEYDPILIEKQFSQILQELDFKINPGSMILLKPNVLVGTPPEKAITTHPEFVRGIIRYLKNKKCRIVIADSSGHIKEGATKEALKAAGFLKLGQEEQVKVAPMAEFKLTKTRINGKVLKELMRPSILDDVDIIINLPKMKTHELTGLTGAIKNMYGTVVGGQKQQLHNYGQTKEWFADIVIDIYEANKPHLSVVDAVLGLEGNGPGTAGKPRQTGLILASTNGYALDHVQEQVMGFESSTVVLSQARKRGLIDTNNINIVGKIENKHYQMPGEHFITLQSRIPGPIKDFAYKQVLKKPEFDHSTCIKCGDCAAICAPKAIKMRGYPKLQRSQCISCYCCNEVCKYAAIKLKPGYFGRAVLWLADKLKIT